ncbi:lasso peptide biosynthesis PqqD family chaperone [Streptacidiphilus pinicola]|uniref:Lasso peptide biosynthesis PqqD family chaperone n=1 Tax=Streptacidiphilus pinicola TaxID=2219663 RepID=A0A2X0IAR0_9ACTN|nr:lasso peptide biosynthesis PqqD family chaperone [Streptacidiphilus pinicola]RAG82052.1 lasso peptide biosynthesis PqqD family chaperone [Streptacidiphilus pinicola]
MRLHPDVTMTDTDDGTVLLHGRTGRYFQLNLTGREVLHGLLGGQAPSAVATALATAHGVAAERAKDDVKAVLAQLASAELVLP